MHCKNRMDKTIKKRKENRMDKHRVGVAVVLAHKKTSGGVIGLHIPWLYAWTWYPYLQDPYN